MGGSEVVALGEDRGLSAVGQGASVQLGASGGEPGGLRCASEGLRACTCRACTTQEGGRCSGQRPLLPAQWLSLPPGPQPLSFSRDTGVCGQKGLQSRDQPGLALLAVSVPMSSASVPMGWEAPGLRGPAGPGVWPR